ncbi:ATPase family associated with various cellular activities (AAA), partial [Teratosphaeria destructans]
MPDTPPFVVRLLPSNAGLEGAFRVHLSPEALEKLALKVGDICHITGEQNETGYGIAWRATDKMGNNPKLRPAKMTDTLKAAFNFREGSQVTIARTTAKIVHADKVVLSDVTPSDYGDAAELQDDKWRIRASALLANVEAAAVGTTFDVAKTKALRKRFCVDHIETTGSTASGPTLFTISDKTMIVIGDATVAAPTTPVTDGDAFPVLDTTSIGGLVEQARALNKRLDLFLGNASVGTTLPCRHILLHGYEGTGKSLLLKRLETSQTSSCNVLRVEDIPTGKVQSTLQSVFKDALSCQPSVIVIDDLERLASPDDKLYISTLARQLDALEGTRVLVIGATRSTGSIDSRLLRAKRFAITIELPVPDTDGRRQILNLKHGYDLESNDPLTKLISMRTHGFTGSDLETLFGLALNNAMERHTDMQREWVSIGVRNSTLPTSGSEPTMNGSVDSQATTAAEPAQPPTRASPDVDSLEAAQTNTPTLEDYEHALQTVKPTALREVILEKPQVRWSDIGGSDAIRKQFDKIIGWPAQHADLLTAARIPPTRGVLLYGPPGCSKTMTAQAVAANYDWNFLAVKGPELLSMYVGESERAVREVFRKAKHAAPCVIFFDEIDSMGAERDGTKGLNVLTTLLTEMDGFETMRHVLVLAATNKPDLLDPALLRPGRPDDSSSQPAIPPTPSAPNFYQRLFPFRPLFQWLNHSAIPSPAFTHREFALPSCPSGAYHPLPVL